LAKDGRFVVMQSRFGKTKEDLWLLPQFGDRKPVPYVQTEASEHSAKISPSGQWLAYVSDETRRDEVYVQSFPVPGGKLAVSTNGGSFPVWSRDGRQLYFIGVDQKMMTTDVKTSTQNGKPTFEASVPKPLFNARANAPFDVSQDGRFLMAVPVEQSAALPFTVVLNWQAGLKK
jgi:Tol biopolymer transport system component